MNPLVVKENPTERKQWTLHEYLKREINPKTGKWVYHYEKSIRDTSKKVRSKNFSFHKGIYKIENQGKFVTIKIDSFMDNEKRKLLVKSIRDESGNEMKPKWQTIADYLGIKREIGEMAKSVYSAYRLIKETGHEQATHKIESLKNNKKSVDYLLITLIP